MKPDRIYKEYTPRLLNYLKTFDSNEAEDLCHDVLLKVLLALPALKDESRINSWIFAIARNHGLTHLKKKKSTIQHFSDINPEELASIEYSMESEKEWLYVHIHELDELDRDIVSLRIYGNLGLEEIAGILEMRASSVRSRMSRIPEKLKKFRFDPQISKTMESIMSKIEHIKEAASVFERMSLVDQVQLIVSVTEGKDFSGHLLVKIGQSREGREFLEIYGKSITINEAVWILNYIDGYTEERVIKKLIDTNSEAAEIVMRNMFVLEDIVLFDKTAIELLWGKVDEQILLTAMIDVPASVRKHMISPFSKTIGNDKLLTMLNIEVDRHRLKSARHFVVEEIRTLVANGSITIQRAN